MVWRSAGVGGGISPYEVAVEAGYTGTEDDFNACLAAIPSAAQQEEWNGKATTELVTKHATDTHLHVTDTERTTWNNAATTVNEAAAAAQAAGMSITKLADGAYVEFTTNYNTGTITSAWLTDYRALLFVWAAGQGAFAPVLVPTSFLSDGKRIVCTLYSSGNAATVTLTSGLAMSFSVGSTYYRISQFYHVSESTKYGDGAMPYVYGIK